MPTHYEVLGVAPTASEEDVRHAYRRLAKTAHPDAHGDPARFTRLTEAYDVLSDPARRAVYDRDLRRPVVAAAAPPVPRRRYGRYVAAGLVLAIVGGVVALAVATVRQSVGDACLVGTWVGEAFEVPFRGTLDGEEIAAPVRGGAGVVVTVGRDGTARADYAAAEPFTGTDGADRIEVIYAGSIIERWRARDGRLEQRNADVSRLTLRATINGRPPDAALAVSVVDREYPYTCTSAALEVGPYRYARR